MTLVFVLLGVGAGVLTTLAGQGGGLLLLLACSAIVGPHGALAITAPALLLGNLHRATLLRRHIDRPVASRMIAGAVPGALAGGLLAGVIPAMALRVVLVAITVVALAKALGLLRFRVARAALVPKGLTVGAMTGAAGGAGILFAPVLLSFGLTGRAFVATSSVIALSTHIGRVAGYAALGLFARGLIGPTIAVTVAILAGNAVGARLRARFLEDGAPTQERDGERDEVARRVAVLEYGTLVVCVVLSVSGLG
jgi:uncharacterized membrane protein YfcA